MSTLRTQMTHDMIVRGFTKATQKSYLHAVTDLAHFAHRRPDQLSDRDVQRYMVHLLEERHLAWSTCNTIVYGLRFFYHVTLGHPKTTFHIPCARQPSKLPVILSRAEVRAWRSWGLCRVRHLLDFHVRIPLLEYGAQFAVEGLDAGLQQQMCSAFRPLHLLLLAEPFAHYLIHRRLDEPRGNRLPVTIPLAIIRDQAAIVGDVSAKLLYRFEQLFELWIRLFEVVD